MLKALFQSSLVVLFISQFAYAQLQYQPVPKVKQRPTFNEKGSGITAISLDKDKETRLTNLCVLWGFIKYYHPNVTNNNIHMDDELFRVLPMVLNAANNKAADSVMEAWVDNLGMPAKCDDCLPIKKTDSTQVMPDYSYLFNTNNFSQSLITKLENIRQNRNSGKNAYVMLTPGGNPAFPNEQPYMGKTYPDVGVRLLSLFRYWNIVQYFYPYRYLIGEDWNKTLTEFIPQFVNAADSAEYTFTCIKLMAHLHDSHADIIGGKVMNEIKGEYILPVKAAFIEDKLVITAPYNDATNNVTLLAGDIIEQINDKTVTELIKKYSPYTPASNHDGLLSKLADRNGFLFRSPVREISLNIIRDDKPMIVKLTLASLKERGHKNMGNESDTNIVAYKIMAGNIGYIYPGKLKNEDFEKVKNELRNTKGIIIDMRCNPAVNMPGTYAEWLSSKTHEFAKFSVPYVDIPGMFNYRESITNTVNGSNNYYKGKVVVIVNDLTHGSGEYAAMALAASSKTIVLGSTTGGADGYVSAFILPGGVRTMMSGVGVLYPDGTETQRKGLKINKVVRPTIKGVKAGKDELLDQAIKIISTP